MKKVLVVFAGFLAIAHIAGFMPFYAVLVMELKNEVAVEMGHTANNKCLVISGAEFKDPALFRQVEEGEYSYKGSMYDVVRIEKKGDTYVLYGIQDNKEDYLHALLKSVFQNDEEQSKKSQSPLAHLMKDISKDYVVYQFALSSSAEIDAVHQFIEVSKGILSKGYGIILVAPPNATAFA